MTTSTKMPSLDLKIAHVGYLKHSLDALACEGVKFDDLFHRLPRARDISLSLAAYLTNTIPFEVHHRQGTARRVKIPEVGESLLTKCLKHGHSVWNDHSKSLADYLHGVFFHLPKIANWQAYNKRGQRAEIWDFCDGPLLEWMIQYSNTPTIVFRDSIVKPPLFDASIRTLVATRMFTHADYASIDFDLTVLDRKPTVFE